MRRRFETGLRSTSERPSLATATTTASTENKVRRRLLIELPFGLIVLLLSLLSGEQIKNLLAPAYPRQRVRSLYSFNLLSSAADPATACRGSRQSTPFRLARALHSNLCVGNRPRAALVPDELGPLRHAARSHRKPLDLCRPSRPASVASFAPR